MQLRASSLNWHDVIVRRGARDFPLPSILGMDGAGTRMDTGEEVVIYPCPGWGAGQPFPGPDLAIIGDWADGTYAEMIAVPELTVFPKSEHLSPEEAAALPCSALTAFRAAFARANLQPGETVLVLGAGGGVSTFATIFGEAIGARVLVTSSTPQKIDAARALGAEDGFIYTRPDWVHQVRETACGGVDVIISGAGSALPDAPACLNVGGRVAVFGSTGGRVAVFGSTGGRVAVFGSTGGRTATIDVPALYFGQASILGTTLGAPDDFANMLEFVVKHQIRPLVDAVYPLSGCRRPPPPRVGSANREDRPCALSRRFGGDPR